MWTFVDRRVVPRSAVAFTLARDEHGYHGDVLIYSAPVSDLARANITDMVRKGGRICSSRGSQRMRLNNVNVTKVIIVTTPRDMDLQHWRL